MTRGAKSIAALRITILAAALEPRDDLRVDLCAELTGPDRAYGIVSEGPDSYAFAVPCKNTWTMSGPKTTTFSADLDMLVTMNPTRG
jgi:hypothetical protein